MPPSAASQNGTDVVLAEVVEEFTKRVQAGESVDVESYAQRYPEHAERLRRLLPALALLDDLGRSVSANPDGAVMEPQEDNLAGVLGDFRIVREVGKGGMGIVYEAEQLSLRRRVALKVLPFAATMDARHLQRFHNEAQAAACLHHTNIVPVFSVGCERGVHFYAMQFIDGQPLSDLIHQLRGREKRTAKAGEEHTIAYQPSADEAASTPLPAADLTPLTSEGRRGRDYYRKVAELGVQAAEALDYAHQLGIVHRDIKPGNLLVDGAGRLWVTDFGLAHMQHGEANLTVTGQALGTPRYMSPEQALAKRVPIDHRTDVYSLGATLYELLTLRAAFWMDDRQELLRQIAFEDPALPRRLERAIPAELEIIVLKAMEKRPQDRYATAQQLADDLRRWLDYRPILARRPSLLQRLRKWTRRYKAVVMAASVSVLLTVAASMVLITAAYQSEKNQRKAAQIAQKEEANQRQLTERERDLAEDRLYIADLRLARQAWEDADLGRLEELLEAHRPQPGKRDLRGWEWYYLRGLCEPAGITIRGAGPEVCSLAWSPDGKRLATAGSEDMSICIWDATTGGRLATLRGHTQGRVSAACWSPDGKRFASLDRGEGGAIRIWDAETWRPRVTFPADRLRDSPGLAWSPDGRRIAAVSGAGFQVWDADAGRVLLPLNETRGKPPLPFAPSSLAWSRDGRRLALGGQDTRNHADKKYLILIWDIAGKKEPFVFPAHVHSLVHSLTWHPDGQRLASAGYEDVRVWEAGTGKELLVLSGAQTVAWSPDGKLLAAPSNTTKRAVKAWDALTGREVFTLRGHRSSAFQVAWSPDGRRLASSDKDAMIQIWDLSATEQSTRIRGVPEGVRGMAWDEQGGLAVSLEDGTLRVWDVDAEKEVCRLGEPTRRGRPNLWFALAWSAGGRSLAIAEKNVKSKIVIWDVGVRRVRHVLKGTTHATGMFNGINGLAWGPGGRQLVSVNEDQTLKVWDIEKGQEIHTLPGHGDIPWCVEWSPDGGLLAVASYTTGTIRLWETASWTEITPWPGHASTVTAVAWDPTGGRLASAGQDRTIRLWDVSSPQNPLVLRGHTESVNAIAWSPDGRRLASAGQDHTVRVWDPVSGQELLSLPEQARALQWVSKGQRLATAGPGGVKLWDASRGYRAPKSSLSEHPAQRLEEAQIHYNLGIALVTLGCLADGETALRESLGTMEALAGEIPDSPEYQRKLGKGHRELAQILAQARRPQEAEAECRQALEIYARLTATFPANHDFRREREETHLVLCSLLNAAGRLETAAVEYRRLAELPPEDLVVQNNVAWFLATCPDTTFRNPALAVELASKSASSNSGERWNTLGVAQYRAGDWKASIAALTKSMNLRSGGDSFDFFFLAMSHWQLGDKGEARRWYNKAVQWMDKNKPQDEELVRFRAEVTALLGSEDASSTKGKEASPKKE